ncbi:MAG: DAK2 domain-containing protein [Mycoplasma sp.]|nr:DAK2 domain-containing protein [Candidatus Hennigella equi]
MTSLNALMLKTLLHNGVTFVGNNFEYIDELNVFPVPDGDTGTNLKITTEGAWEAIKDLETDDLANLTKTFARGLLMNARGNSGVILSQIFKGFSSVFSAGQKEASLSDLTKAFVAAKEFAYKSVATPVEGTILTVIRVTAEKLNESTGKFKSIEELFEFAHKEAKIILDKTPDFLIQLKEVGVVDSGGYGLTVFIEGMKEALLHPNAKPVTKKPEDKGKETAINKNFVDDNEGFGYCSEFIMKLGSRVTTDQPKKSKFDEIYFKKRIQEMGDCFVYVRDDDIIKVHVHVIQPYKLLEFASKFGEFTKIKIENMTLQFMMKNKGTSLEKLESSYRADNEVTSSTKVVATVPSQAMKDVYANEFGITHCLNCDDIGNPTIQQFYDLIKSAKSRSVIVVTDNGNILMAAEQAKKLFPKKTYNIEIIPSKDIATSYLTCLSFNPELEEDDIVKEMERAFKNCESCKISKSVKNIRYKDLNIKFGDYIGVRSKEIVTNSRNESAVCMRMIDEIFGDIRRPKTAVIIYGKDGTMEEVNKMYRYINEKYLVKPIIIQGNQSTYHYYIGVTK